MTKIVLKFAINSMPYHYLTTKYYTFTSHIEFEEHKTSKRIVIPWNNIAVIVENYEETK